MHYEKHHKSEDAEWVLFIHGLGGSISTWKYQMDAFSEYNILCVDLQGHGQSTFVKSERPEQTAACDIHEILVRENIPSVHIVSLSLGTIVAMEFAYMYPESVSSMTLAGCVLNLNIGRKALLIFAETIKYILPIKTMYSMFASITMPKKNHKTSRDIFIRESLKMTRGAFISWINALMSGQKRMVDYIRNINIKHIPVLFVTGDEDYLFRTGVLALISKIKGCKCSFLKKCGHVCSIDKKEQFNDVVLSFLGCACAA